MYESPRKKGRPLTENERNLIAHLLRLGFTQTAIAKEVGVYPSTICREIRRGEVELLNSDKWIYYKTYSPQKAQMQADYMKTAHGPDLKIGNCHDYLAALEAEESSLSVLLRELLISSSTLLKFADIILTVSSSRETIFHPESVLITG